MTRFCRRAYVALLTFAGLTACSDQNNVSDPTPVNTQPLTVTANASFDANGLLTIVWSPTGGVRPYQKAELLDDIGNEVWEGTDTAVSGLKISDTKPHIYKVVVSDSRGNSATGSVTFTAPAAVAPGPTHVLHTQDFAHRRLLFADSGFKPLYQANLGMSTVTSTDGNGHEEYTYTRPGFTGIGFQLDSATYAVKTSTAVYVKFSVDFTGCAFDSSSVMITFYIVSPGGQISHLDSFDLHTFGIMVRAYGGLGVPTAGGGIVGNTIKPVVWAAIKPSCGDGGTMVITPQINYSDGVTKSVSVTDSLSVPSKP